MKSKKIVTLAIAAALAMSATATVAAATLTEENNTGNTQVTANVTGPDTGDITYKIIIPDVVDFGNLTIPSTDDDSYVTKTFDVTAEEINGIDPETQSVTVYVKRQGATTEDTDFYIANEFNDSVILNYSVFNSTFEGADPISDHPMTGNLGYYFGGFKSANDTKTGRLRLNQNQLYGKSVAEVGGSYSGYMTFFSTIQNDD